jgi:hypothetical protein
MALPFINDSGAKHGCTCQRRDRRARKGKQRRMARQMQCWQVHGDLTKAMNLIDDKNRSADTEPQR